MPGRTRCSGCCAARWDAEAVQPLPEKKIVTRIREHYAAVQKLRAQGLSKAVIGRKLGLHRATVRKFAEARSVDDLIAKTEQRPSRR